MMVKINHDRRRERIERFIDDDPWTITVYRDNKGDAADTSFVVDGRLSPAGTRSLLEMGLPRGPLLGEGPVTQYTHVLVTEWDAEQMIQGDQCVAVHNESEVTVHLTALFVRHTPFKYEVYLDSRQ